MIGSQTSGSSSLSLRLANPNGYSVILMAVDGGPVFSGESEDEGEGISHGYDISPVSVISRRV